MFYRNGWLIFLSYAWHFHSLKQVDGSTNANLEDKYVDIAISSLWELLEANERVTSTEGRQSTFQVLLNLALALHGNNANKYLQF